jgi:hypothetical protein
MLSIRTKLKLISIIENYPTIGLDRMLIVFGVNVPNDAKGNVPSRGNKANVLFEKLKAQPKTVGPFGKTLEEDVLQYILDDFYNKNPERAATVADFGEPEDQLNHEDLFSNTYSDLANLLKQDGLIIKGRTIRSLIPVELEAAQVENELIRLLRKYNFAVSEGHLSQAILNHTNGNWAGANSQFRPFIESLLIDISGRLAPGNPVTTAQAAINVLSGTVHPPFLATILNEVQHPNCNTPFVIGLWKRLHPQGPHPGLSDEEDCTFRYHICMVFSRYLLARLEQRNP